MILIISENNDLTTNRVIEWLHVKDIQYITRINEDDQVRVKEINLKTGNIILEINSGIINLSNVDFFWYRRGSLNTFLDEIKTEDIRLKNQLYQFLNMEWMICRNYIIHYLQEKPSLGNYHKSATNKLINLNIAQKCGLDIPDTIISDDSETLKYFRDRQPAITKPISEAMAVYQGNGHYNILTSEVSKEDLVGENLKFPMLLQEKIDKEYEIRSFVLKKKIYSMAIFSQENEQTCIDYRNYDHSKMNRMIPYSLPKEIELRILLFMEQIGLDTGSIDLIRTKDNKYIFLEVNPAGNIEMVSDRCNYMIEKDIAKLIINTIRKNEK